MATARDSVELMSMERSLMRMGPSIWTIPAALAHQLAIGLVLRGEERHAPVNVALLEGFGEPVNAGLDPLGLGNDEPIREEDAAGGREENKRNHQRVASLLDEPLPEEGSRQNETDEKQRPGRAPHCPTALRGEV